MAARKKWFASAIIAAVILVVMLWRVRSNHSQPTYQGKPFSYWFREYCLERSNAGVTSEQILVAFRAMGSNAAPCLVKELLNTNHDSKLRKVCQDLADGLPVALQRIFPGSISADRRRDQAEDALFHTKPSIHVLLPLLINALNSPDVMQRRRALFALGGAGDGAQAAVPYLMVALKDRDMIARNLAAQSLGFLGADASVAVVDLIGALQDPPIRWKVVTALGNAGPAAQIAIPTLRQMIATDTGNDRLNIAAAIYKIDPTQSDAFAILADALRQKADPKLRIA